MNSAASSFWGRSAPKTQTVTARASSSHMVVRAMAAQANVTSKVRPPHMQPVPQLCAEASVTQLTKAMLAARCFLTLILVERMRAGLSWACTAMMCPR